MQKKPGYFFLALVPFILAIVIQVMSELILDLNAMLFGLVMEPDWEVDFLHRLFFIEQHDDFSTYLMIIYSLISIGVFGFWYYQSCGGCFKPNVRKTFNAKSLAGAAMLAPGMQFATSILMIFIYIALPGLMSQYSELMEDAGLSDSVSAPMMVYAVILAPICEELIFRGVTLRCFRKAVPFWVANLLQALLFGIYHMNWVQGIYTFCFGLVLGYVCERGGHIYYSMLLHFVFNFFGTIVSELIGDSTILVMAYYGFGFACLVGGIVLFALGMKEKRAKENPGPYAR